MRGACLYRQSMLEEIGLFDPDYFISYEDIDIGWRGAAGGMARWRTCPPPWCATERA